MKQWLVTRTRNNSKYPNFFGQLQTQPISTITYYDNLFIYNNYRGVSNYKTV